ncbi:MAG: ABC transporter ATP-binding protein [Gammaproteobacteria bacterium]
MSALLRLEEIGKSFFTDELETRAVSGVNLEIHQGDFLALTGPSGCGKSTLLAILGLLDSPTTGQYHLRDQNVSSLSREGSARIRNKDIGFVFQSFNLISDLTVEENVMLPLTYQRGLSKDEMNRRVANVLDKVEMSHRARHHPFQLSGGQQQRVAVSRALVNDPAIILADEPTGNLDSKNAEIVMGLLDQLHADGSTICMVTHDPDLAGRASRRIEMLDGLVKEDGVNASMPVVDEPESEKEVGHVAH